MRAADLVVVDLIETPGNHLLAVRFKIFTR